MTTFERRLAEALAADDDLKDWLGDISGKGAPKRLALGGKKHNPAEWLHHNMPEPGKYVSRREQARQKAKREKQAAEHRANKFARLQRAYQRALIKAMSDKGLVLTRSRLEEVQKRAKAWALKKMQKTVSGRTNSGQLATRLPSGTTIANHPTPPELKG